MKIKNIILSFLVLGLILSSCEEDFLETAPTSALSSDVMFESFDGAQLALNGIYARMYYFDGDGLGHHGAAYFGNVLDIELMGEDMTMWDRGYGWYTATYGWLTHRTADGGVNAGRWLFFYDIINQANIILLYADDIEDATSAEIANVKAQALIVRSLGYLWLVQSWAHPYNLGESNPGVPIYTEPSQEGLPRSTVGQVYDQIIEDIEQAITYFEATADPAYQVHRSHTNLAVAHGLYARAALAMNDYTTAAAQAQEAIANSNRSLYTPGQFAEEPHALLNDIGASEIMWGVQISGDHSAIYASFQSHMDARFMSYASLGGHKLINRELYDNMSASDVRRGWWIAPEDHVDDDDYYMAYNNAKLLAKEEGSFAGDLPIMRLSEIYLINAEALARGGGTDAQAAQALYDYMINRDPNYTLSSNTGDDLLEEIMFHRRIELWGEGFRFHDLQRTGKDLVRTAAQGHNLGLANILNMPAGDARWLWLIPQDEIDANDAISSGDQNP